MFILTVEKNNSVTRREYIVKMRNYNKGNLVTGTPRVQSILWQAIDSLSPSPQWSSLKEALTYLLIRYTIVWSIRLLSWKMISPRQAESQIATMASIGQVLPLLKTKQGKRKHSKIWQLPGYRWGLPGRGKNTILLPQPQFLTLATRRNYKK